ncbi:hypothetical protein BDA96_07G214300 [Sorghum bicolor]|uniref:Uncharacterized protein n=1 Tax=Sorghum bicolor TaxID=4558 RepID=A0A921UBB8_SORBI|nr:hypothetical protein BDA96_07G214300 [Sorghum bicolor]
MAETFVVLVLVVLVGCLLCLTWILIYAHVMWPCASVQISLRIIWLSLAMSKKDQVFGCPEPRWPLARCIAFCCSCSLATSQCVCSFLLKGD